MPANSTGELCYLGVEVSFGEKSLVSFWNFDSFEMTFGPRPLRPLGFDVPVFEANLRDFPRKLLEPLFEQPLRTFEGVAPGSRLDLDDQRRAVPAARGRTARELFASQARPDISPELKGGTKIRP